MSVLVYGITRIVTRLQLKAAQRPHDVLVHEFIAAYDALEKAVNGQGDLKIHLSVEAEEPLQGVKFEGD